MFTFFANFRLRQQIMLATWGTPWLCNLLQYPQTSSMCSDYLMAFRNAKPASLNATSISYCDFTLQVVEAIFFFRSISFICKSDNTRQDTQGSTHVEPTHRTRMEKRLMSLSNWSSRAMDWMIMLSTLFTLNLTLARE